MSEDQKNQLQSQLWKIANELRGKMDADEFRDYILGFIFYKYLSEKMNLYANTLLEQDDIKYDETLDENNKEHVKIIEAVKRALIDKLGYFLKPSELFHRVTQTGLQNTNLVEVPKKRLVGSPMTASR